MIAFKYKLPEGIKDLAWGAIYGFNSEYIKGYMPEGISTQLKHYSLFMVCDLEIVDDNNIYKNPVAIVAKNESRAAELYAEIFEKYGFVFCELSDDASKITVEA